MSDISVDLAIDSSTLVDLLRSRATHQPSRRAYTFLESGGAAEANLTYSELDMQARSIGALLQSTGAFGERVLLLYPPGLSYIAAFLGCLYAGAIAVPTYPPRLNRPDPRLDAIVADAQATAILTTSCILSGLERRCANTPELESLLWLATDDLAVDLAEHWCDPGLDGEALAFLQYTSGSTASPKGVLVDHSSVLYNERMIQQAFEHTEESVVVGWLPLYHDMGLIGNVLQPLSVGALCILMSPLDFLQNPFCWLHAISRYRACTSGGPNFAYDLCVRKIAPEQRVALDLSSWRVAFNGSESVREQTLDRFTLAFEPCGFRRETFYPCYGLAEATLFVSGGLRSDLPTLCALDIEASRQGRVIEVSSEFERAQVIVGCGRTWMEQQIVIVDPDSLVRCPPGHIGEIWVSGPNLARGYWNLANETERTFQAYLLDTGEGPFLRTGDLGFLRDGELFITGRIKDLIIVRGCNHYPQDIEMTAEECHSALQEGCGAAFAVDVDGEERLVIVYEVKRTHRDVDVEEVARAVRQAVTEEHGLQVYALVLLKPASIPRTSSGKIQRYLCQSKLLDQSLQVIGSSILETRQASFDRTEEVPLIRSIALRWYLQRHVARILGVDLSKVDAEQPLVTLGLDSLMAIELAHSIESTLGVKLSFLGFLRGLSITQVADAMLALVPSSSSESIPPTVQADPQVEFPLSHGQRVLWRNYQLASESTVCHIRAVVRIRSELDVMALRRVVRRLAMHHAALRTTFAVSPLSGEPVQCVHEQMMPEFETLDVSTWSERDINLRLVDESRRAFDLVRGPLVRIRLFNCSERKYIFLVVVHRVVSDLWSLAILARQLGVLYASERTGVAVALPESRLQYSDYVRRQTEMLAGPRGEQLGMYWREQMSGELSARSSVPDCARLSAQSRRGDTSTISLCADLVDRLEAICRECGATLYMMLLAAFQVLLCRHMGQRDFLVCSLTAGRNLAGSAEVVGCFANPILLRTRISPAQTFLAFLDQTRQTVLAALEHQDYPYELVVSELRPVQDCDWPSPCRASFVFQRSRVLGEQGVTSFSLGIAGAQVELGGLLLESMALESRIALFDIALVMGEIDGRLLALFEYNADLPVDNSVAPIAVYFEALLKSIVDAPNQCLAELLSLSVATQ